MMLWPLALLAGAISFTSPCCLPLLPGYLAHVSGLVDPAGPALRSRTALGALLFVGGFAVVFTLVGASLGLLGGALLEQRGALLELAGGWIVAMAALQITGARPTFFARTAVVGAAPAPGMASSFPLGMAFAASWTPCVGPVLASILVAASAEGSALEGAGLLFVYSVGLGVPFVLSALALQRVAPVRRWLLRQHRPVEVFGGLVLLAMGLLLLSGQWLRLMGPLLRLYANLNWPPF